MTEDNESVANLETKRHDLYQRLPGLIDLALRRYLVFTREDPPTEPKAFGAYSTACRAALNHLEQLFKLARLAAPDTPIAPPPDDDIDGLIASAEAALEKAANDT